MLFRSSSSEWTSMGTLASVRVRGGDVAEARDVVRAAFSEVERLLNAHDKAAEICTLASLDDDQILSKCSPVVKPCYAAAFQMRDDTEGLFNPRWKGLKTLDLGAIAKGFAVDLAAERLREAGLHGEILVDLGGNLKSVSGEWRIALYGSQEVFVLKSGEAAATSGEYFRGKHIFNGRTLEACSNRIYSVTIIHPSSAMRADALSTALFIMGKEKGSEFLNRRYPEARAIWL